MHTNAYILTQIYTFGAAQLGQLGRPTRDFKVTDSSGLPVDEVPSPALGLEDHQTVTKISSGFYNTLAITGGGELYCCGENQNQQCGNQHDFNNLHKLSVVNEFKQMKLAVKDAKGGYCHSLVLTEEGRVFTMGCADDGQRGDGKDGDAKRDTVTPVVLPNSKYEHVTDIAAGANHSLVLTSAGNVYAFGSNEYGQCGKNTDGDNILAPTLLSVSNSYPISSISAGYAHTVLKDSKGTVFMCGQNTSGQLGLGKDIGDIVEAVPTRINEL